MSDLSSEVKKLEHDWVTLVLVRQHKDNISTLKKYVPGTKIQAPDVEKVNAFRGNKNWTYAHYRAMLNLASHVAVESVVSSVDFVQDSARAGKEVYITEQKIATQDQFGKVKEYDYFGGIYEKQYEKSAEIGAVVGVVCATIAVDKGEMKVATGDFYSKVELAVSNVQAAAFNEAGEQKAVVEKTVFVPFKPRPAPLGDVALSVSYILELLSKDDEWANKEKLAKYAGAELCDLIFRVLRRHPPMVILKAIVQMNSHLLEYQALKPALQLVPSIKEVRDGKGYIQCGALAGRYDLSHLINNKRPGKLDHYFMKSRYEELFGGDRSLRSTWLRSTNFGIVVPLAFTKLAMTIALVYSALKVEKKVDVSITQIHEIPTIINSLCQFKVDMKDLRFVVAPQEKKGALMKSEVVTIIPRPDAMLVIVNYASPAWSPTAKGATNYHDSLGEIPEWIKRQKFLVYTPWISAAPFPDGVDYMREANIIVTHSAAKVYVCPWWDNYRAIITNAPFDLWVPYVEKEEGRLVKIPKKMLKMEEMNSYVMYANHLKRMAAASVHRPFTRNRDFVPLYNWVSYNKNQLRHSFYGEDGNYVGGFDPGNYIPTTLQEQVTDYVADDVGEEDEENFQTDEEDREIRNGTNEAAVFDMDGFDQPN